MRYLFLALLLTACATDTTSQATSKRIVAFGDSHTYGNNVETITYADMLVKKLGCKYNTATNYASDKNVWYTLDNQSMGGTTFTSRWQYDRIMNYKFNDTDVAIMILGGNDVVYNGLDTAKLVRYKERLFKALNRLKSLNIRTYVGTCIVSPDSTYALVAEDGVKAGVDIKYGSKEACNAYAQATKDVVKDFSNVTLIDTNAQLNLTDSDMIDGVHLKLDIHNKIVNMFINGGIN